MQAALVPFALLLWRGFNGDLTADPLVEITNETGIWTLRFIVITLAITPIRRVSGWNAMIRFRRMLGLFAFFYGMLHFLTYRRSPIASRASIFLMGSSPGARS